MTKAMEDLADEDALAFQAAIDPHVRAVLGTELEALAELQYAVSGGLLISSFTATPATIEMGPATAVELAWTIEGEVTGQTLNDSVAGAVALDNPVTDRAKTVSFASSRTFEITATNAAAPGGADTKTRQVTVLSLPRRFWGASAAAALDAAGVIALGGSELSAARGKSFTVDAGGGAGKFVYYAYLASLGAETGYRLFGYDDDPVTTTVSITTAAGLTANYTVLRSPNALTGSVPVEVS